MKPRPRTIWERYGVAALCVAAAGMARWVQGEWFHSAYPFAPFLIAMLVSAWYGGFGPAILASVASVVVSNWMSDDRPPAAHPLFGLSVYVVLSLAIAGVGGVLARARERIERQIEELKRHQDELRAEASRKDEFLAILAHELRNPLAPISNALQILKLHGAVTPAAAEARDVAERQHRHLTRLVDDLLDVSRIMRGKIELRKERVELATVVSRAIETVRPMIDAERHQLSVNLPKERIWLLADLVRLAQVLANLLSNAAKYTEQGGQITLTVEREDWGLAIRVRDTGIGIAPEAVPRLFEMFMQIAPGASRSQGGLGIGLTLVKSLVAMHGGTVEAVSAGLGKGSEFVVRLPAEVIQIPEPDMPPAEESPAETAPRRILVVDDNVDAAQSLAMLLKLRGHAVQVAFGGAEALAAARAELPQAAFLDIGMPGMDGYEVARRMRAEFDGSLRLIALTGWGTDQDRQRSRAAGFDHHLTKPVDLAGLEGALAVVAGEGVVAECEGVRV